MILMLTFDLDLDMEQGHTTKIRSKVDHSDDLFYYKVNVKRQDLRHYPAKLLKLKFPLDLVRTVLLL